MSQLVEPTPSRRFLQIVIGFRNSLNEGAEVVRKVFRRRADNSVSDSKNLRRISFEQAAAVFAINLSLTSVEKSVGVSVRSKILQRSVDDVTETLGISDGYVDHDIACITALEPSFLRPDLLKEVASPGRPPSLGDYLPQGP